MLDLHPFTARLALLALVAALNACPAQEPGDSGPGTTSGTGTGATGTTDSTGNSGGTTSEPTTGPTTGTTTGPTSAAPTTAASTTDVSTTDASTTDVSGSTTDEPPPALCPDHTATDACCCFEEFANGVGKVCGTQSLCPEAVFDCSEIDATCTTKDEAPIDCVLTALADGTMVGALQVQYYIDGGYGQRRIELFLQGDGTAYAIEKQELDLSGYFRPTGRYILQAQEYFTTCLASDDVQAKSNCLEDITGALSEVCFDGFNYNT